MINATTVDKRPSKFDCMNKVSGNRKLMYILLDKLQHQYIEFSKPQKISFLKNKKKTEVQYEDDDNNVVNFRGERFFPIRLFGI